MSDLKYAPIQVALEKDKKYSWCTCSFSQEQPFCDGSHRANKATPPLVFQIDENKEAWLCTCKQTNNPPYCDGTHNA